VGRLLFLLPILAWAQAPTGRVHGVITNAFAAGPVTVRIFSVDPAEAPIEEQADDAERFNLRSIKPGWHVLSIDAPGFHDFVHAVKVEAGKDIDLGTLSPPLQDCTSGCNKSMPLAVLTVCEALESRERYDHAEVVIVGIFKSGLDETLRQDCPNQLVTGDVGSGQIGWMSAIALTRPTDPPESLRAEIEKKRAIVLASGPPGAHPRPERVTALYGRLVSPSGLTSVPCCTAPVEINAAPARLVGLDERDFRVLR
jgi:hypothetical protein